MGVSMAPSIRLLESAELAKFVDYLDDHVRDNGAGGTALFQPMPRGARLPKAEKLQEFTVASETALDKPNWRRFWVALDGENAILGHVDLRARREPHATHRTVLGMGVHRDHRGKGLGKALLQFAWGWALQEPSLDWMDLEVIATNAPARALYQKAGFNEVGTFRDMFRMDGASVDYVHMTKALR